MATTLDQIKQNIPDSDRQNPSVSILLELLEQHIETIALQKEQIQQLKDEIARLKTQKPKPKISPSNLSQKGKKQPTWRYMQRNVLSLSQFLQDLNLTVSNLTLYRA